MNIPWKKILGGAFVVVTTGSMLVYMISEPSALTSYKYLYRNAFNVLVLGVVAEQYYLIVRVVRPWIISHFRLSEWSLLRLIGLDGVNLNIIGFTIPVFGPLYGALLIWALPAIAVIEEWIFRSGTTDWWNAWHRSIVFGFGHMLIGVTIADAMVLSYLGLFLSGLYFAGGLSFAWLGHLSLDAIGVSILIMISAKQTFLWIKQKRAY